MKMTSWEPSTSYLTKLFAEHAVRKYGTLPRSVGEVALPILNALSSQDRQVDFPQLVRLPTWRSSDDRLTWLCVGP